MTTTPKIVAIVLAVSLLGVGAQAAAADNHDGPTVVATGLDQPRQLAFNGRGDLFIGESGSGGDLEEIGVFAGALHCTGLTGAVTRVDKSGRQRRVVTGLPSAAHCDSGAQGIGPGGLVPKGRQSIIIQMGSTAHFNPNTDLTVGADEYGRVLRTRPNGTILSTIADITSFEATYDPDGEGYDSNPTDIAAWGRRYVITDAGANAVHVIDNTGRRIRTVEVPQDPCPGGPGNCFGDEDLDSVPTGIVRGRGNTFYISTLSGVAADFSVTPPDVGFQPGRGKVFAFDAKTGEISEFATDLTTVIDVAFDRRTNVVYAAEFLSGAVWAIDADTGQRTRVDEPGDLVTPGGLAVDRLGNLYVSTFTAAPGNSGQVVRYDR
ncbi:MAG: ScyD/ScyE family protein [Acidimicrobiales bacterium]